MYERSLIKIPDDTNKKEPGLMNYLGCLNGSLAIKPIKKNQFSITIKMKLILKIISVLPIHTEQSLVLSLH